MKTCETPHKWPLFKSPILKATASFFLNCRCATNSLLQCSVINYVCVRCQFAGVKKKTSHHKPSHNCTQPCFCSTASTCKCGHVGLVFLLGSLFCRRYREGRGHHSVLKASGYCYQHLCRRTAWLYLPDCKEPWNLEKPKVICFCEGLAVLRLAVLFLKYLRSSQFPLPLLK